MYSDLYLLEAATGTDRAADATTEKSARAALSFSPDCQAGWRSRRRTTSRRTAWPTTASTCARVAERGKPFRKLGASFDGDVGVGFWSKDGSTIYFNEGIKATNQLLALDVAAEHRAPAHATKRRSLSIDPRRRQRRPADQLLRSGDAADDVHAVPRSIRSPHALVVAAAHRRRIRRSQASRSAQQEEITWKSKDGKMVGGVLVKPVGYRAGQRYPLIVAIHGGPAAADVLGFNGGYGSQVYAGAGYVVLRPNYRGSTNYGEKHKTDIVGNYFAPGFDDIMTGVDHLIAQGIVDRERMGALGWSAGGHWSNWILTHTNRFKAISSGAGTVELDLDVRAERRAAEPPVLSWQQAAVRRLRRVLEPVAAQVHQEREDADDDSRRRRRSARAEPAVGRAAHGAQAARRADRAVHVSRQRRTAFPTRATSS